MKAEVFHNGKPENEKSFTGKASDGSTEDFYTASAAMGWAEIRSDRLEAQAYREGRK